MKSRSHFLSHDQRSHLMALQRQERDVKINDRIKTILLLDDGLSYEEVARVLFLSKETIIRYEKTYLEEDGVESLCRLNYSGKPCELNGTQLEQVKSHVKKIHPESALPIIDFIQQSFGVNYTRSGVVALLHRLGFSYKKPKQLPGKSDPLKQKQFIEDLERLEKELQPLDEIVYMDGVHPQHNSKPAYGWFQKGEEIPLRTNSGRKRLNINGALNANSLEVITVESDSVNAQSTLELFKKLEAKYPNAKRIVGICDNARYYRSKLVSEYLENSKIELKFLPPYAPNLNLIERLWRFMNKKVRNNRYYCKFMDFKKSIIDFFDNISLFKEDLKSLLVKNFHIIKQQF